MNRLKIQEPSTVEVVVRMPDETAETIKMPIQLPHKILEYLIVECGLNLQDTMVKKYWDHLESVGDDVATQSAHFRRLAAQNTGSLCWPLGIHGDEANIGIINNPTNKVIGMTLNIPLFRPRSTRLSRWLLFAIESERVWSVPETLYPVLTALTESINHCIEVGVAGRRFIFSEFRGDQAWFKYIFRHDSHWVGNNVCFRCKATSTMNSLNYTLEDVPGGWESTYRSTADFINDELTQPKCYFDHFSQNLWICF